MNELRPKAFKGFHSKTPATTLAREAIDGWLRQQARRARHEAIAAFAAEAAGGEILWADLAPRSGSEPAGRCPVVIVSHDGFNQTQGWSQARRGPTVVEIPAGAARLPKTSYAVCHQVTTLDRAKLTKSIDVLPMETLGEVELGLKAAMDLE
jgi:mRNA interferase MazF